MRTAFFGTPELAIPALAALADTTDLVAVVCQPDRKAGRGMRLTPPATKRFALEHGIEVHQPVKVRTGTLDQFLLERQVEAAVVLAYGRILPPAVLRAPRLGCINLHASLLPKYRGAAPIQWAIVRGETRTGISLMQMDEGLDTGPVFCARELEIGPRETGGELSERIAALAALVVREDLPRVLSGELTARAQDASQATLAPPLTAADSVLDWTRPAQEIINQIRGLAPRPGAHTELAGVRLRICAAERSEVPAEGPPGTVSLWGKQTILVSTGSGALSIVEAQLAGRKSLAARDLINGRVLAEGMRLGA